MKQPDRKNQHYVWAFYLEPWASGNTFFCHRQAEDKLFATQPKSVANEKYFYEMQKLTAGDMFHLDGVIKRATSPRAQEINRNFVRLFQQTFELRDLLARQGLSKQLRDEIEKEFRLLERNLGENYHTGLEEQNQGFLRSLRACNSEFCSDDKDCADFLYFLSNQYFRTARMRNAARSLRSPIPDQDYERTFPIEAHIYSTNVGRSFFETRRTNRIIFLRNETPIPFVAGDQPVVNTLNPQTTNDIEFYYPLTPRIAMILTLHPGKFPKGDLLPTETEVHAYNRLVYSLSDDQLYSNDREYLTLLVKTAKDPKPG